MSTLEQILHEGSLDRGKTARCPSSRQIARLAAMLILILGAIPAVFGQQITGAIVGTVKDPQERW